MRVAPSVTTVSASGRDADAGGGTPEVVEVEVERLPSRDERRTDTRRGLLRRLRHGLGPVVAGIVIDAVDFTTFGSVGLVLGFPVGGACGYWLARELGFDLRKRLFIAVASGLYCMFPPTTFFPVATLCGVAARLLDRGPADAA